MKARLPEQKFSKYLLTNVMKYPASRVAHGTCTIHDNDNIQLDSRSKPRKVEQKAMNEAMSMHAIFVYTSQSDFEKSQ